jgi:hypothetical protein
MAVITGTLIMQGLTLDVSNDDRSKAPFDNPAPLIWPSFCNQCEQGAEQMPKENATTVSQQASSCGYVLVHSLSVVSREKILTQHIHPTEANGNQRRRRGLGRPPLRRHEGLLGSKQG